MFEIFATWLVVIMMISFIGLLFIGACAIALIGEILFYGALWVYHWFEIRKVNQGTAEDKD